MRRRWLDALPSVTAGQQAARRSGARAGGLTIIGPATSVAAELLEPLLETLDARAAQVQGTSSAHAASQSVERGLVGDVGWCVATGAV